MEKYEELRDKAAQKIKAADHMLNTTLPLVKDYRMLPSILEHIFLGMTYALQAVLAYDLLYKRIPSFDEHFQNRVQLFKSRCLDPHHFKLDQVISLQELHYLLLQRKKSHTEFIRHDRFVMCAEDYQMTTLSEEDVKNYLKIAKKFVFLAGLAVSRKN